MKRHIRLAAGVAALSLVMAACGPASDGGAGSSSATTATWAADAPATAATAAPVDSGSATTTTSSAEADGENAPDHDEPGDYLWDEATEVTIDLDDMTADGASVAIDAATVVIRSGGTYRIHGTLNDGRLIVESGDGRVVRLILDGAAITNSDGPAIHVEDAAKAVIVLADGSENSLTDGGGPEETDEPNAALYSTADLTITGGGSLSVEGTVDDGIGAKDGLVVSDTTLVVTAVDDGIRGKDYLVIAGGSVTVTAGGDGLKSDNGGDPTMGYVSIRDATVDVTAAGDGIDAVTDVLIGSGSLTITTTGGSGGALTASSAKGIKGLASVIIDGGSIAIDSADDAVHSNDTIIVNGGELVLATGDDGMHADAVLELNDATITITDSYEGFESAVITVNSGSIEIHSDDDGVNVAGGNDGSGMQGPGGRGGRPDDAFTLDTDYQLHINGGTILIYAQGDGLDSNGTATMTGGTAIVHGPTADNNGAIDAGTFEVSGGLLVAVGSSGMAEGVDVSSPQAALRAILDSAQPAGTIVHIAAGDGTPVLTFEPAKPYASVVFSSPDLEDGTGYEFYFGGNATGDDIGGLYAADAYGGGDLAGSLTAG